LDWNTLLLHRSFGFRQIKDGKNPKYLVILLKNFFYEKIFSSHFKIFYRKVLNQFKVNWDLYAKTLPWPGDYFLHEKESWPILFLYSDADKVVVSTL